MPRVVIGYGHYRGYRLSELPRDELDRLHHYYPLELPRGGTPEPLDLMVTIAVNAEVQRRRAGGGQEKPAPTLRELALEIVDTGYRKAAEKHRSHRNREERMLRLNQAREFVIRSLNNVTGDLEEEGIVWISDPAERFGEMSPGSGLDSEDPF